MPTTHEQLQRYLDEPEGMNFDSKETRPHYHFENLVDYCVALANEVRSPKSSRPFGLWLNRDKGHGKSLLINYF